MSKAINIFFVIKPAFKIRTALNDLTDIKKYDNLLFNINYIIDYIKKSDYEKIIIVSHTVFLNLLLKEIFRINILNEDYSWICYLEYYNNNFYMISPPNTEHLIE
jgi:hypothetical protein